MVHVASDLKDDMRTLPFIRSMNSAVGNWGILATIFFSMMRYSRLGRIIGSRCRGVLIRDVRFTSLQSHSIFVSAAVHLQFSFTSKVKFRASSLFYTPAEVPCVYP